MRAANQDSRAGKAELLKTVGVGVWVSFLFSAVATTLFFATFDPQSLAEQATFPMQLSREAGYTIGFILFWLLLMLNSAMVLFLSNTSNKKTR